MPKLNLDIIAELITRYIKVSMQSEDLREEADRIKEEIPKTPLSDTDKSIELKLHHSLASLYAKDCEQSATNIRTRIISLLVHDPKYKVGRIAEAKELIDNLSAPYIKRTEKRTDSKTARSGKRSPKGKKLAVSTKAMKNLFDGVADGAPTGEIKK